MLSQQIEIEVCSFVDSLALFEKNMCKHFHNPQKQDELCEEAEGIKSSLNFLRETLDSASKELSREEYINACANAFIVSKFNKKITLNEENMKNNKAVYTAIMDLSMTFVSTFTISYCSRNKLSDKQLTEFMGELEKIVLNGLKNS